MSQPFPLDPDEVNEYCRSFWGYGTWGASLWTVGMEEGVAPGIDPLDELRARLAIRRESVSARELTCLPCLHRELGYRGLPQPPFFAEPPGQQHQPTWSAAIRTVLAFEGAPSPIPLELVQAAQRTRLGRFSGGMAVVELLPLPNHSANSWGYHQLAGQKGLEDLASRAGYEKRWRRERASSLVALIKRFEPRGVLLYGAAKSKRDLWADALGVSFRLSDDLENVWHATVGATKVVLAPHPMNGIPAATYEQIGRELREHRCAG